LIPDKKGGGGDERAKVNCVILKCWVGNTMRNDGNRFSLSPCCVRFQPRQVLGLLDVLCTLLADLVNLEYLFPFAFTAMYDWSDL